MPKANDHPSPERVDTREHILNVACRCFARSGRDGVTMRQISAETGLTMPTLYHHFGDKSALYAACVASVVDGAAGALRDAFSIPTTPAECARACATTLCEHLLGNSGLLPFLQMESVYGSAPLQRLVPEPMRDKLDAAIGGAQTDIASAFGPASRLVAYAFGYAAMARAASPDQAELGNVTAIAELLLSACRVERGPAC